MASREHDEKSIDLIEVGFPRGPQTFIRCRHERIREKNRVARRDAFSLRAIFLSTGKVLS